MNRTLITMALAVALVVAATAAAKPSKTDKRHAQQECRAERGTTDATREAFAAKYGTNANDRNAFGKCVSQKAQEDDPQTTAGGEQKGKPADTPKGPPAGRGPNG